MARLRSIMQKHVDPETGKVIWKVEVIDPYRAADMAGEANAMIDVLLYRREQLVRWLNYRKESVAEMQELIDETDQEIKHHNDRLELAGRPRREIPGDE